MIEFAVSTMSVQVFNLIKAVGLRRLFLGVKLQQESYELKGKTRGVIIC